MKNFRIYLANLGKYNEGDLVGKWINLPITPEQLAEDLKAIGIDGVRYEETAIHDYEAPIAGMEISEYADIMELSDLAEKLEDFTDHEVAELKAYSEATGYSIKEALEGYEDDIAMFIHLDGDSDTDLAGEYIDMTGGLDQLDRDTLEMYFDQKQFARDLSYSRSAVCEDMDDEGIAFFEDMTDEEFADYYIYEVLGGLDQLDRDTLETYFDYEGYGSDMRFEGWYISDDNVAVCTY